MPFPNTSAANIYFPSSSSISFAVGNLSRIASKLSPLYENLTFRILPPYINIISYFYLFQIIFNFHCSSSAVLNIITQDSERLLYSYLAIIFLSLHHFHILPLTPQPHIDALAEHLCGYGVYAIIFFQNLCGW